MMSPVTPVVVARSDDDVLNEEGEIEDGEIDSEEEEAAGDSSPPPLVATSVAVEEAGVVAEPTVVVEETSAQDGELEEDEDSDELKLPAGAGEQKKSWLLSSLGSSPSADSGTETKAAEGTEDSIAAALSTVIDTPKATSVGVKRRSCWVEANWEAKKVSKRVPRSTEKDEFEELLKLKREGPVVAGIEPEKDKDEDEQRLFGGKYGRGDFRGRRGGFRGRGRGRDPWWNNNTRDAGSDEDDIFGKGSFGRRASDVDIDERKPYRKWEKKGAKNGQDFTRDEVDDRKLFQYRDWDALASPVLVAPGGEPGLKDPPPSDAVVTIVGAPVLYKGCETNEGDMKGSAKEPSNDGVGRKKGATPDDPCNKGPSKKKKKLLTGAGSHHPTQDESNKKDVSSTLLEVQSIMSTLEDLISSARSSGADKATHGQTGPESSAANGTLTSGSRDASVAVPDEIVESVDENKIGSELKSGEVIDEQVSIKRPVVLIKQPEPLSEEDAAKLSKPFPDLGSTFLLKLELNLGERKKRQQQQDKPSREGEEVLGKLRGKLHATNVVPYSQESAGGVSSAKEVKLVDRDKIVASSGNGENVGRYFGGEFSNNVRPRLSINRRDVLLGQCQLKANKASDNLLRTGDGSTERKAISCATVPDAAAQSSVGNPGVVVEEFDRKGRFQVDTVSGIGPEVWELLRNAGTTLKRAEDGEEILSWNSGSENLLGADDTCNQTGGAMIKLLPSGVSKPIHFKMRPLLKPKYHILYRDRIPSKSIFEEEESVTSDFVDVETKITEEIPVVDPSMLGTLKARNREFFNGTKNGNNFADGRVRNGESRPLVTIVEAVKNVKRKAEENPDHVAMPIPAGGCRSKRSRWDCQTVAEEPPNVPPKQSSVRVVRAARSFSSSEQLIQKLASSDRQVKAITNNQVMVTCRSPNQIPSSSQDQSPTIAKNHSAPSVWKVLTTSTPTDWFKISREFKKRDDACLKLNPGRYYMGHPDIAPTFNDFPFLQWPKRGARTFPKST